jgi:hypothetical protein
MIGTDMRQFGQGPDALQPPLPNFEGMVKGALDGFGTGSIRDIIGGIESITGGQGGFLFECHKKLQ